MNLDEQYLQEFMLMVFQKGTEGIDLLQSIDKRVTTIEQTTNSIDRKIDVVLEKLTKLESDFSDLKNENREIEEKISLMTSKLSKIDVGEEELEDYTELVKKLYTRWDDYDTLTQSFLPIAEYLYSKLQKYDKPDYSPVVLELCTALENEFLLKLFTKYTYDLLRREGNNIDVFLSTDRSTDISKKTSQFVKAISKAKEGQKPFYTLGEMRVILSNSNKRWILAKSPLMRDFAKYLVNNTKPGKLLDTSYMNQINDLAENYRNHSAHPENMTIEQANKCKEMIPERLDYLMDCLVK